MKSYNAIHKYELRRTKKIARALLENRKSRFNWRIIVLPLFLYDILRDQRRLQVLHKNLFFTKKFALEAGKHIYEGKERAWEIRLIEVKTRETLSKEKKAKNLETSLEELEALVEELESGDLPPARCASV